MALTLKNDVMFKAVYGREDEDCKEALIGMLNLILDRKTDPIKSVTYRNPFNVRETDSQKEGILDIKAETDRGELLDIEMQFAEDDEIIERNLYYHCGMVTQGLAAGEKYGKLKKTISILLLNFTRSEKNGKFHTRFMLKEPDTGELLTELFQLHYIELPKVNPEGKPASELSDVERFLEYLKYAGELGKEEYVEELKRQGGKEIQMTDTIMRKVTEDELVKEKAIARDKFLHWQASIERQRKRQEAEKAELLQQLAEFAEIKRQLKHAIQGMAAAGMNAAQIAETIGMQEAEVEQYLS
ncbi:Rpn family recombination-promoting nuclease/putative transposase [Clostridiales bacterium]|nr:Rpn family recombination-promoting nuclease/putative transposase [Clostridiales bacterium]